SRRARRCRSRSQHWSSRTFTCSSRRRSTSVAPPSASFCHSSCSSATSCSMVPWICGSCISTTSLGRQELVQLGLGGTPRRSEVGAVPAGGVGTRLVGALEESEQRRPRVGGRPHRLVGKERERAHPGLAPVRLLGSQGPLAQPRRLRCRVRVVGRLAQLCVAG